MVSVSVSKEFGIEKSIGFGIEKIWYQKKYRIRYRKNLVSEKSFGFGFVQILGIVTHCYSLNSIQSALRGSHGLNARRARRTESRGPKGLHSEVWARRAPRLLVMLYWLLLHIYMVWIYGVRWLEENWCAIGQWGRWWRLMHPIPVACRHSRVRKQSLKMSRISQI